MNTEPDPNLHVVRQYKRGEYDRGLEFRYDDKGIEIYEDGGPRGDKDHYIYLTQMEALKLRAWLNTLDLNMMKVL